MNSERNARFRARSERATRSFPENDYWEEEEEEEESVRTWTLVALRPAMDAICWVAANIMFICSRCVFLCVWMTICSRALKYLYLSRRITTTVLVKKRAKVLMKTSERGEFDEFFRKKRCEKRDKRESRREETSRRGVFQESAKKKTKILILAHVFTTLNKTHLHKHHVCCYSTNRVRRRPQGHQGSGTNEFGFASRAVKVDFERRRWEIFCYRESNQKKRAVVMKNRFFSSSSSSSSSSREEKKPERIKV